MILTNKKKQGGSFSLEKKRILLEVEQPPTEITMVVTLSLDQMDIVYWTW